MANDELPEWEILLRAAAHLQGILPDATIVGGTAAAMEAGHRRSMDVDHEIAGLTNRFDNVLAQLELAAGWQTSRVKRPVVSMGTLDGILTTVRNQIRAVPLETKEVSTAGGTIRVPIPAEILRIKAWLVLQRKTDREEVAGLVHGGEPMSARRDRDGERHRVASVWLDRCSCGTMSQT